MGKGAIITGAAKGLGAAITLDLAEKGYDIALHHNSSFSEANQLSEKIKKKNVRCELFKADFLIKNELKNFINKVSEKFNNIDLLINNASVFERIGIADTNYEMLEKHTMINFFAPFYLIKEYVKNYKEGHVINILDSKITKKSSIYSTYTITKRALSDLTKFAAKEFAPDFRANGIAVGLLKKENSEYTQFEKKMKKKIPMTKACPLSKIFNAIEYLENEEYITGNILFIDGGIHLL